MPTAGQPVQRAPQVAARDDAAERRVGPAPQRRGVGVALGRVRHVAPVRVAPEERRELLRLLEATALQLKDEGLSVSLF